MHPRLLLLLSIGLPFLLLIPEQPTAARPAEADPLPSWNEGANKKAILSFVRRVTDSNSREFVPQAERIATFDNDGTLWCEQPMYVQVIFIFDRIKELAAKNPGWKKEQPYKAILENDRKTIAKFGDKDFGKLLAATSADMTPGVYKKLVADWLAKAKHPRFKKLYKECLYQPQLELLKYLRANGFKTYIVSGGGVDFIRAYADKAYGIPPEQVIGSSDRTRFEIKDGKARLIKLPLINSIDDKEGKPININLHIGRRPILAFGNSDGDLAMLQYTAAGAGPKMMLILHHDDEKREYAYDRKSHVGRLDKALDAAKKHKWNLVSMKKDFKKVFPFDK